MLAVPESAAGQDQGKIAGRMSAGRHPATVEDGGVIQERAAVDGIFLRLEPVDQVGHHRDLEAFDLLQGPRPVRRVRRGVRSRGSRR